MHIVHMSKLKKAISLFDFDFKQIEQYIKITCVTWKSNTQGCWTTLEKSVEKLVNKKTI